MYSYVVKHKVTKMWDIKLQCETLQEVAITTNKVTIEKYTVTVHCKTQSWKCKILSCNCEIYNYLYNNIAQTRAAIVKCKGKLWDIKLQLGNIQLHCKWQSQMWDIKWHYETKSRKNYN